MLVTNEVEMITGDIDTQTPEEFSTTTIQQLTGHVLAGSSPLQLLHEYTEAYAGRMRPLPAWTQEGAIVHLQGGMEVVNSTYNALVQHNATLAAVWVEDWCGLRVGTRAEQVNYNWVLAEDQYPLKEWNALRERVKTLVYINPFFINTTTSSRNLYAEAIEGGYVVLEKPAEERRPWKPIMIDTEVVMLDVSNPGARRWFKDVIKTEVLANSAGFMHDYGEWLPLGPENEVELFSGDDPVAYHNVYTEIWAALAREAVWEYALENSELENADLEIASEYESAAETTTTTTTSFEMGISDLEIALENAAPPPEYESAAKTTTSFEMPLSFVRTGQAQTPGEAQLFWVGDQMTTWSSHDGMATAVTSLLSSGLSGFSLSHSDAGGFAGVGGNRPGTKAISITRSKELLLRWVELNFFTAILRTHMGSNPGGNAQIWDDAGSMQHFARMSAIYAHLADYRRELMEEAWAKGWPLVRPLLLHYPDDAETHALQQQFMLGAELIVVPVLDPPRFSVYHKPRVKVDAYLPRGSWARLWHEDDPPVESPGGTKGYLKGLEVQYGQPLVFYPVGSRVGRALSEFCNGLPPLTELIDGVLSLES